MSHIPRYPANEADWVQHRESITQLYHWNGLSLSQVMANMLKAYGFKATLVLHPTLWFLLLTTTQSQDVQDKDQSMGPDQIQKTVSNHPSAPRNPVDEDPRKYWSWSEWTICEYSQPRWASGRATRDDGCTNIRGLPTNKTSLSSCFLRSAGRALPTYNRDLPTIRCEKRILAFDSLAPPTEMLMSKSCNLTENSSYFPGSISRVDVYAFKHKSCGQQTFFFDDIVTSICYAARRDYQNAGEYWRSAFRSIEAAIDREDPEFLVALMWSVTFLNGIGCGEVVSMLQNYVLHLTSLRANRPDPLLPMLASFAGIHRTHMIWLRGLVLDMILEWSTTLSREDPSLFKVYSWSSLPGADGVMSIALTSFVDFKSLAGDKTGQVGPYGKTYAGERLIFLARRKQEHRLLSGQDEQGRH